MTLEDVIGRQIGDQVRISCPFPGHDDNNPSAIYYADGHVHCFACGGHASSLVDLIRQREYPNFPEATGMNHARAFIARYLKDQPLPEASPAPARPVDDPGPDNLTLLAMTTFCDAARANLDQTPHEFDKIVRERGLKLPTAMGIGLADSSLVRITRRHLERLGFGDEAIGVALERAGVLGKDKNGLSIYRLSNRIIVPEFRSDPRHAVYYQARANNPAARQKYLNPPIRNKPLFGWDSLSRGGDRVWIGEGPFDMLPFLEAGESAVSSMGAHMTGQQITTLAKTVGDREVLVAFDNDDAGRIGARRIVDSLKLLGVEAHAVFPRQGFNDFGEWAAHEPVASIIPEVIWYLPS